MTIYPSPNTSSIPDLFSYANNNTCILVQNGTSWACSTDPMGFGWFFPLILFTIFGIALVSQKDTQPMQNALALSSFIVFLLSVLLLPIGLNIIWTEVFFVMLLLSVMNLWRSE